MCTVKVRRGLHTVVCSKAGIPVSTGRLSQEQLTVVPGSFTERDGVPAVSVSGSFGEFELFVRALTGADPKEILATAARASGE